ncbi:hypothetical protein [Blastomonas sp. AAP53]|uniref:hypothetical protein n=1 Tax=Blastomonas sp. AAP53 TaxID=1248760 RepID=UPI0002F17B23|nr:hypothetical protein [Blastomonas sp. AAP53]
MTQPDKTDISHVDVDDDAAQSLAEVSARRLAARSQWQMALARAKDRFAPANLRDEAIDTAAHAVGNAADRGASLAWAHRGKIALAGLLGGLFLARKPIREAAGPLTTKAKGQISKVSASVGRARKR